jgi:hypothetical protein
MAYWLVAHVAMTDITGSAMREVSYIVPPQIPTPIQVSVKHVPQTSEKPGRYGAIKTATDRSLIQMHISLIDVFFNMYTPNFIQIL